MDKLEVKQGINVSWEKGKKRGQIVQVISHTDIKTHEILKIKYEEYEIDEVLVMPEDSSEEDQPVKVTFEELQAI